MNMHSQELDGWRYPRLGDIAEVVGGKPAPQKSDAFDAGGIPFVRMKDLGRYHLTTSLSEVDDKISREYAAANRLSPLRAGAILMPRSGSVALNHRAILGVDAIIVSHICALVPNPSDVYNKYLYYYLCTVTMERITKKTTGLDAINFADLREIRIPLPKLSEQRRIADILDKADSVRQRRRQVLSMADRLLLSEFVARFGSPIANSKALPTAPIKAFGRIVTGNTPPRKDVENYGRAIEWIKSDNINTPNHFITKAEEGLSEIGRNLSRTAPAGATLVTCIAGSPNVIGNAALTDREVAFNQQINAVIPFKGTDPYFLYCQFLVGKALVQGASTNSMKGMVSKGKFQEIEFLKPPSKQQSDFGFFFVSFARMIERLQNDVAESKELFSVLSGRAFRGDL